MGWSWSTPVNLGTVASMAAPSGDRTPMPLTSLGPGGPPVSRIGLGLAALGRPAYITGGRDRDLPDRSVAAMRERTFAVLDAAYAAGIRYADAARSYGRAEEFLGDWLSQPGHPDMVAGSKWGYRYIGGWRLDVSQHEVKEHSLAMFRTQAAESRSLLGDRLSLYQVHSLTLESGLLDDDALLGALGGLRDSGVIVGLTTSGPRQADTLRRALDVTVAGRPLFAAAQVTWNLLEPSAVRPRPRLPLPGGRSSSRRRSPTGGLPRERTVPGLLSSSARSPRTTESVRTRSRWLRPSPTRGRRSCYPARSLPASFAPTWQR